MSVSEIGPYVIRVSLNTDYLPDADPYDVCPECGSDDPAGGFVNFGCVDEDCPGCDRCDLPCISCNPNGRVR